MLKGRLFFLLTLLLLLLSSLGFLINVLVKEKSILDATSATFLIVGVIALLNFLKEIRKS